MKKILLIAALLAASNVAFATGDDDGCRGNCRQDNGGVGDITNTARGGAGGEAYAGAAAGAVAGANAGANAGASALNVNSVDVGVKSSNRNTLGVGVSNRNANVGINHQGQTSSNTNLIGGSSQSLANDSSNRNYMEGQANAQSMTYNEAEGVRYSGEYTVKSAPPASAPSIDPTVPCAIPVTGAGSGVGFGISLGTAYVDRNCELREDVRLGLSGDAASRSLANQVIQTRLRAHLNEESGAVASGPRDNATQGNYTALTNY